MGSERPQSPSRASSRSFYTAYGSTELNSTGRRITGFPQHGGNDFPARDSGGGEIARCLASARKGDRAFNIDPPTSSYAIMRRACPYCGENSGPGKERCGELDIQTRN